ALVQAGPQDGGERLGRVVLVEPAAQGLQRDGAVYPLSERRPCPGQPRGHGVRVRGCLQRPVRGAWLVARQPVGRVSHQPRLELLTLQRRQRQRTLNAFGRLVEAPTDDLLQSGAAAEELLEPPVRQRAGGVPTGEQTATPLRLRVAQQLVEETWVASRALQQRL